MPTCAAPRAESTPIIIVPSNDESSGPMLHTHTHTEAPGRAVYIAQYRAHRLHSCIGCGWCVARGVSLAPAAHFEKCTSTFIGANCLKTNFFACLQPPPGGSPLPRPAKFTFAICKKQRGATKTQFDSFEFYLLLTQNWRAVWETAMTTALVAELLLGPSLITSLIACLFQALMWSFSLELLGAW